MTEFIQPIAGKLHIKTQQVETVLNLLAEGATIPFIARYRKDKTGALDEVQIQQIQDEAKFLKVFAERKAFIEKTITELGKMTVVLQEKLNKAASLVALEDIYLPYKVKRKTRAQTAKENGLEDDFQELSIDNLKKNGSMCQVELKPGSSIRKKGTLQRGQIKISDRATKLDRPLYLVVSSNRKWARQEDIKLQRYSLVISLTHTNEEVRVYHQIQTKIQERSRQQLRIR